MNYLAVIADAAARLLNACAVACGAFAEALDGDDIPDTVPCCWTEEHS